jgi:hypothetical protein
VHPLATHSLAFIVWLGSFPNTELRIFRIAGTRDPDPTTSTA